MSFVDQFGKSEMNPPMRRHFLNDLLTSRSSKHLPKGPPWIGRTWRRKFKFGSVNKFLNVTYNRIATLHTKHISELAGPETSKSINLENFIRKRAPIIDRRYPPQSDLNRQPRRYHSAECKTFCHFI